MQTSNTRTHTGNAHIGRATGAALLVRTSNHPRDRTRNRNRPRYHPRDRTRTRNRTRYHTGDRTRTRTI
jgi:hypothetical protein